MIKTSYAFGYLPLRLYSLNLKRVLKILNLHMFGGRTMKVLLNEEK